MPGVRSKADNRRLTADSRELIAFSRNKPGMSMKTKDGRLQVAQLKARDALECGSGACGAAAFASATARSPQSRSPLCRPHY